MLLDLSTPLPTGDEIRLHKNSIVIAFRGRRAVLSTSPINGGYREDLSAVFNHDISGESEVTLSTYAKHMEEVAEELGLDPQASACLSTAAQMENAAIVRESHGGTIVTAIVTGGIDVNGGRAGDPADLDELLSIADDAFSNHDHTIPHGTINIILHVNVGLTPGALTRALVTCTEAKTAAIQELIAPSKYSTGLATGSGTDGAIIIANAESYAILTDSGNHVKLGELIGKSVKAAVKEALYLQTGLSPDQQHNIFRRVDRFGITIDSLWQKYQKTGGRLPRAIFTEQMNKHANESRLVTQVSLYCHLIDQMMWGLISPVEAVSAGMELLSFTSKGLPSFSAEFERHTSDNLTKMTNMLELALLSRVV